MYKLILVDDEEEVRSGIIKKIKWDSYGFEIVGEAENGREALDVIEKTEPDLIISDIKMPFMDGIELCEIVREKYPMTKIILFTGFDDFEYAKKAIKLNVIEYVLKPISSSELEEVLVRAKEKIDEEKNQLRDINILREHYKESIPILKEKFLSSLISGKLSEEEIREKAQNYNINFKGERFTSVVIRVDNSCHLNEEYSIDNDERLIQEIELKRIAIFNICDEIIKYQEAGTVFLYNDYIVIIFVSKEKEKNLVLDKMNLILEEIRQKVEKYLEITVTIGIGNMAKEIKNVNMSYKNAIAALDYRIIIGINRVIWIEDVEPQCVKKIQYDEIKEHSLISAIKVGTTEELDNVVDNLFAELSEGKASLKDYQIYVLEILMSIIKVAKTQGVDLNSLFGDINNIFMDFNRLNSMEEQISWMKKISSRIMGEIAKDRYDNCKMLIEKAKTYVNEHFTESDVTINGVCKYLHISPTYFSYIFKKETKTTFINYLTQIRMEEAKALLRATNMKTFEIAQRVGYSEPNYFSYSFKKKFGVSPSEFRNGTKNTN